MQPCEVDECFCTSVSERREKGRDGEKEREGERRREISSRLPLQHTDGELNQCHRPDPWQLLLTIHTAAGQAHSGSQRTPLNMALMWGSANLANLQHMLMLKVCGLAVPPCPPDFLSQIKSFGPRGRQRKQKFTRVVVAIDRPSEQASERAPSPLRGFALPAFPALAAYFSGCLSQCQG